MKRSWISILFKLLFFLNSILLGVAFSGCCPSLVHVEDVILEASKANSFPKIIGPEGRVPKHEATAVIKRPGRRAWWSDILQRQISLAELIGGSPLSAGNKATLLIDTPANGSNAG